MPKTDKSTIQMIMARKKEILKAWLEAQYDSKSIRLDLINKGELATQSEDFLDAFVDAIKTGNLTDVSAPEYKNVVQMLGDISRSRTRQGFSPSETAMYVFSLKDTLLHFLQDAFSDKPEELNKEVLGFSKLLDSLGLLTFEAYTHSREDVIQRQQQEILELSTPVIRIWKGVLSVPLIGTLDSARTQTIMENLLQQIVATESSVAILDISGVPAVDTLVAQHLLKTTSAARLMGAECIISGIRPEIAQTMVNLGVDINVKTKATLGEALKEAFSRIGLRVVRVEAAPERS
ncbi:anti-anti-sigma regulatory factor (antagonist of anti-sigma factor) [Desulfocurvibacter africanus PCS]|uniref:Anti-anti-sigma regulatory factor (Antagonist of anti-sigma factor) n=1 Tax=Desulfocurvibacter africanus PCS TaxID=1262666 RepID=M5PVC6_DESAF|nr:STAS domain-containing protein [Desulfocurvibacter africanus]EMG37994.1 anti-anti-sigma regulatory factor (antagonist of anti-sigma factor) [Desulfocurvibacter africanus PCS]